MPSHPSPPPHTHQVPAELLVERVVGRRLDPETGAIYHLTYKPPPPEVVPRLVQRSDDTEEKVSGHTGAPVWLHYLISGAAAGGEPSMKGCLGVLGAFEWERYCEESSASHMRMPRGVAMWCYYEVLILDGV